MFGLRKTLLAAAAMLALGSQAQAFEVGIIGFQFSSETHARVANAHAGVAAGRGQEPTLGGAVGELEQRVAGCVQGVAGRVSGRHRGPSAASVHVAVTRWPVTATSALGRSDAFNPAATRFSAAFSAFARAAAAALLAFAAP